MNWLSMVANRLLWFVPTLVGLLAIVFVLSRVIPVDPAVLAAGENSSPEQVQQVRERFGFDKPLPVQFVNYLRDIAQGNLGVSLFTQQPIIDDLKSRLPATLELTIFAVLIAGLIGIPLGVFCGLHRNSWIDHVLRVVTVSGLAVASFWLAMQFQFLFSMKLGWLPLSGRIEGFPPETVTGLMLVDAMIEDGNFLNYQAKLDDSIKVVIDPSFKDLVDYNSIGLQRGDSDWLTWVNMFVFELNTSGKGRELYRKWFNADMPAPLNPQF